MVYSSSSLSRLSTILKLTPQSQYGIIYQGRLSGAYILKLTPQSQYGIDIEQFLKYASHFEVDSTESVWYTAAQNDATQKRILKLTPQSQYGICK